MALGVEFPDTTLARENHVESFTSENVCYDWIKRVRDSPWAPKT